MQVCSGDLQVVAEDVVVGDLEGLDARLLSFSSFQASDPAPPVPQERVELIDPGVEATLITPPSRR